MIAGRAFGVFVVCCAATSFAGAAFAQAPACAPVTQRTADSAGARAWPAPLDRRITLRAQNLPLRDALDRVAAQGKIRLSYSAEFLPPNKRVCLDGTKTSLGILLADLLAGSDLEAVAIGGDQVVLERRVAAPVSAPATPIDTSAALQLLEPVLTVAQTVRPPKSVLTSARTIIDGTDLAQHAGESLANVLNGFVPGIWMWDRSASPILSGYASVRGASSFGSSGPKTYIDGVEVANPVLATLLAVDDIERIEIIRGPQGSALYGADALSGVVNITTRHDGSANGAVDFRVRSNAGVVQSQYATSPLMAQDHSVMFRAGSGLRNFGLTLSDNRTGAYIPGAESRETSALATGRRVGEHSVLNATARLASARAASLQNDFLASSIDAGDALSDSLTRQTMRQYTIGLNAQVTPESRWSHSFALGVDGYRVSGLADQTLPLATLAASSFLETPTGADRASLRSVSTLHLSSSTRTTSTLTFAAEHTVLREVNDQMFTEMVPSAALRMNSGPSSAPNASGGMHPTTEPGLEPGPGAGMTSVQRERSVVTRSSSSGASAQMDVGLRNTVFLTGGVRVERTTDVDALGHFAALPMFGAAVVRKHGDVTVEVRGAYGMGIRAPHAALEEMLGPGARVRLSPASLVPERQSGTELGVEFSLGRALSLSVTRFDQVATGLSQRVLLESRNGHTATGIEHVGEITNRGWEIEQRLQLHSLSLSSTLTFVDSRVRTVAASYEGDLRSGDRMLGVPALTAGATLGYRFGRTFASIGFSHASDWLNYDMLALRALSADAAPTSSELRDYWRQYSSVTQLRFSASHDLGRGVSLILTGENLLGQQRGAPDNATVLPGRTTLAGLRVTFR